MGHTIKSVILDSNRAELMKLINQAPAGAEIEIRLGEPHTLAQRSRMRGLIRDISKQVLWQEKLAPEEHWKNIFTAILKKETLYQATECVLVLSGESTKDMRADEMSAMINLIQLFGDERNVDFKVDKLQTIKQGSPGVAASQF